MKKEDNEKALKHMIAYCNFIIGVNPLCVKSHQDLESAFEAKTRVPREESFRLLGIGRKLLIKSGDPEKLLEKAQTKCTNTWGYLAHKLPDSTPCE